MNGRISNLSDILDFDKYLENNDLFIDISQILHDQTKTIPWRCTVVNYYTFVKVCLFFVLIVV